MIKNNRFFILGSQRSGTNLMRLILDSHPNVWVFGEPTAHWLLDNNKLDLIEEAIDYWFSLLPEKYSGKNKLIEATKVLKEKKVYYFGYTTPGWSELFIEYKCIKEKLNDIKKIIFMIRNPLDVVDSIINLKNFSVSTLETMRLWLTDENRSFKKRYQAILENKDPIIWYSVYWQYKTEAYFKMLENNYDIIPIKYEDLCMYPKETTEKATKFLGIHWHDNFLSHNSIPHFETTLEGLTNGRTDTRNTVFKTSINKNNLKQKEIDTILSVTEETVEKLGYKLN
jgi:hypothetical protein